MARAEALEIYQDVLDIQSDALLARDFARVLRHVRVPCRRRTLGSSIVIETQEDLETAVISLASAMSDQGVDQCIRLASDASFLSPNYIEGWHVTHVLRNGQRVSNAHENRSVLRRENGVWQLVELDSTLTSPAEAYAAMTVDQAASVHAFRAGDADQRRSSASAFAVYQCFLDRLSQANLDFDFDAYSSLLRFPMGHHAESEDIIMHEPSELRPFIDVLSRLLIDNKADRFVRAASHAEFLGERRICGYHSAIMYRGEKSVLGPIRSRMMLERHGEDWLLMSITNAIEDDFFASNAPRITDRLVTLQEIADRSKDHET